MNWLAPLGFIGFIGVIALIIIYIIKPNYQQKFISSTYVWKLSLKYKKRRVPMSKLNDVLLFICQALILSICAMLLAQPVLTHEKTGDENEKIIIIDASASMLMTENGETRFTRAVTEAKDLAEATLENGGSISLILADATPEFIVQRKGADDADAVIAEFDLLLSEGSKCTYGSADMEAAITLTEEVLSYNYEAQIYLYTATEYLDKSGVFIQPMAGETEWNAAILGASAKINENNHYEISVDGIVENSVKKIMEILK